MQVNVSMRHGHLSLETQQKIREKVSRIQRFFERLTAANITIDLEHKDSISVEIRVSAEHAADFLATGVASNATAAVDGTVHKLEQQIRRHKEKLKGHKAVGLKHQGAPLDPEAETDDGRDPVV